MKNAASGDFFWSHGFYLVGSDSSSSTSSSSSSSDSSSASSSSSFSTSSTSSSSAESSSSSLAAITQHANIIDVATTSSLRPTATGAAQPPLKTEADVAVIKPHKGLSSAEKTGLGVGLGLGLGLVLLAAGAFFLIRRRRQANASENAADFYHHPTSERTGDLEFVEEQARGKT